jgi:hypothetical protein
VDDSSTLLLVGVIFLAIGAVFIALAAFFLERIRRFLRTAVSTEGVVLELIESSGSEGGTVYQAVVQFETADGRTIRWQESMASNPPAGQVGDQVPMKYDPANPQQARVAKTFRLWFLPGLFASLGILFLGIGAILTVVGIVI